MSRLTRLGGATSQFFNVLIFNGQENYSISTDAYRRRRSKLVKFIDWLMSPWETNHCRNSYEHDLLIANQLLKEQDQ